jgi:hypothetical protein
MCAWTAARAQSVPTGTMTLSMSNGACNKTLAGNDGGSRMLAKRGGNVRWHVVNNCSANATVALGDWTSGGGANNPFDAAGKTSCVAAAGKDCMIALHIRSNAAAATYSYSVSVNGTKQDPDLIIEG